MNAAGIAAPTDSPEARKYNRIRRWLGIAEFVLAIGLLVALLATGWSGSLQAFAYRGAFQSYALALFLYVFILALIAKALGFGLDCHSFQLEHRYQLPNQKARGWLWGEVKGFLVTVVLSSLLAELLYLVIRHFPQHWWAI